MSKIQQEAGYLLFSYASSVAIIFLNKYIYTDKRVAGTLLMALHFLSCYIISILLTLSTRVSSNSFLQLFKAKILPVRTGIIFALNIGSAILIGNLSLIHNSITVYQLAKLMVIPCILAINYIWFRSLVEPKILACLMFIVFGMALVIGGDFYLNLFGSLIALLAIIFGASSQIAINYFCKEYELNGFELLLNHSLYSCILVGVLAVPIDGVESISYSFMRFIQEPSFFISVIVSCFAAFVVNIAGYLVIGKLSPLTFQVLGHAKTISILIGGYLFFGNDKPMSANHIVGIIIALLGTIAYSYFKYLEEVEKLKKEMYLPVATNDDVKSSSSSSTKDNNSGTIEPVMEDNSLAIPVVVDDDSTNNSSTEKKKQEV